MSYKLILNGEGATGSPVWEEQWRNRAFPLLHLDTRDSTDTDMCEAQIALVIELIVADVWCRRCGPVDDMSNLAS